MSSNQEIGNVSNSDVAGVNINGNNNNISKKLFVMPSEYHMRAAYLVTVMSIFSLIVAIGGVVWMCHKGDSVGFENISFGDASVTALGVITAILLGWNIYSVIDVKSVKNDYEKFKNDLEQKNKENLEKYKNELSEENKFLKEAITDMQKQIKSMDIFGENEGLCAVYRFKKKGISGETIKEIRERIVDVYLIMGIPTSTFLFDVRGVFSIVVLNGGISNEKADRITKTLSVEFGISEMTVKFGTFEELTGIPVISKRNN